ncbi:acyltransferase [Nodularia sp. NIES-3585]|uniref:acyltransferase n=1 Tax=Nodularia sp. NIES-3585 TaxID=1973477 RepID=UPI000B5C3FDF|nr:acyltransferase [Nodularia sp. NIES-3585]GAX34321.1 transferase hexapeptide repeat protein [Nodularia sp. NIES-3585]
MYIIKFGFIQGKWLIDGLESRWRNFYYRTLGVKLHGYIWMKQVEIPRNYSDIELEADCALDRGVTLVCSGDSLPHPKIVIGANTYINRHTFIDAIELITLGQHCAIGPGCYITDHDHGCHPSLPPLAQPMISKATIVGDRVWIGANVTILKGVTIGNDAVVGAGSVVTKDIPEKAIAVGNPAKVIKYHPEKVTTPEI